MAKIIDNILTKGLSGKLGKYLIFRNRNGKTFVAKACSRVWDNWTDAQVEHHNLFRDAIQYGKKAIANEKTKAHYNSVAKPGQTAFNAAVSDFMNPPKIATIDISNNNWQSGKSITILATDNFMITEISVDIYSPENKLLESGSAKQSEGVVNWQYTTKNINPISIGAKVVVTASDYSGNKTLAEQLF